MGVELLVGKGFRHEGIGGFAIEGATSNRPVADDSNSVSMKIGGRSQGNRARGVVGKKKND